MEELSYPVVSDAVRRTPSIYTRTVRVKNAANECELLESLDAPPEDRIYLPRRRCGGHSPEKLMTSGNSGQISEACRTSGGVAKWNSKVPS
jgi:hypothetical protein